jgi:hypothetical protein
MFKFYSLSQKTLSFRQLVLLTGIMLSSLVQGQSSPVLKQVNRLPASYIPDDDVIVKPIDNELSFYQQYVLSDNSEEVIRSRNQLKIWNDNQTWADQYGLDSSLAGSTFFVPTPEEKWEYFKDRYLRYLRRKGEQPFKDMPKNWYNELRASNEVDTIDEMEERFKKSNGKASSGKSLPQPLQAKEVSLWKETKFIFQPRVDQGLVIVGIRGPIAFARAWVGVNGRTEFNVQKNVDSIGFRAMFNYQADNGKYFTSLDQRIVENVYARFTTSRDPASKVQDETLMLLYAKQF